MKNKTATGMPPRQDRRITERVHDPYMTRLKLKEPAVCPDCGVVFHKGRWQWMTPPDDAREQICPACQRVHDSYPAGHVKLAGNFVQEHKDEIMHLVTNQEKAERNEHPMHRIMDITREDGDIVITTTDIHLPRRIGEAVHHAYQGDLDYHYEEESYSLHVVWSRDR